MAEFIGPVTDWLVGVIAGMDVWAEVRKSWTGVVINWPPAAVMPRVTDFDPEGQAVSEAHGFTVKFGVSSDDPDQVTYDAWLHMKAIDDAIRGAVWPPELGIARVFVSRHDYGPLFQRDNSFAKFPELQLVVETFEL